MKIVFTCDTMGHGGAEKVISSLANQFSKKGHQISIVMVSFDKHETFYKLNDNIELIPLLEGHKSKPHFFRRAKLLKKCLFSLKPDIVIGFLPHVCIYTWLALRHSSVPFVLSERNDPNKQPFIQKALVKQSFFRANWCVFQTDDAKKWYGNKVSDKSSIILNPVYLSFLPKKNRKKTNKILYVGRLEPQKNCFFLIDVFKRFLDNNHTFILKIVGDGSQREQLLDYIRVKGLENSVVIEHSNANWHEDESDAAAFILGSNYEGMPNVLAEALCLGIPAVATDCPIGGPRELKKLFPERLLLSNTNNLDLFSKNIELCINSNLEEAMIIPELRIDSIADKWLKIIEKVIDK